jgi:hypothetical protein
MNLLLVIEIIGGPGLFNKESFPGSLQGNEESEFEMPQRFSYIILPLLFEK